MSGASFFDGIVCDVLCACRVHLFLLKDLVSPVFFDSICDVLCTSTTLQKRATPGSGRRHLTWPHIRQGRRVMPSIFYIYIYIIFAIFAFGIEIGKCVNSSLFRVVLCMHSVQHVNGSVFFGYAKHCKSQPLGLQNATNIVNSSVLLKYWRK